MILTVHVLSPFFPNSQMLIIGHIPILNEKIRRACSSTPRLSPAIQQTRPSHIRTNILGLSVSISPCSLLLAARPVPFPHQFDSSCGHSFLTLHMAPNYTIIRPPVSHILLLGPNRPDPVKPLFYHPPSPQCLIEYLTFPRLPSSRPLTRALDLSCAALEWAPQSFLPIFYIDSHCYIIIGVRVPFPLRVLDTLSYAIRLLTFEAWRQDFGLVRCTRPHLPQLYCIQWGGNLHAR